MCPSVCENVHMQVLRMPGEDMDLELELHAVVSLRKPGSLQRVANALNQQAISSARQSVSLFHPVTYFKFSFVV